LLRMVQAAADSAKNFLFATVPSCNIEGLIARMRTPLTDSYDVVKTVEEYEALEDKYKYDGLVILYGGAFMKHVLNDQAKNSGRVKWAHSLSAGIDAYVVAEDFVNAEHIPLTNVKGAFSHVLGEFIALGMLYHGKKLENFMKRKAQAKWEIEPVELCQKQKMVIVGFGDIGAACGKVIKNGFGTKVIGVKKRPEMISDEHRQCCDELVGLDQLDSVVGDADYVVGVLPKTPETTGFFDKTFFAKMKSSGVFMNIGRGPTVNE